MGPASGPKPPGSIFEATLVLRRGDTGPSVVALQERLLSAGHSPGCMWGVFGRQTQEAVVRFQASRGLPTTGVADRATLEALFGPDSRELWGCARWLLDAALDDPPSLAPVEAGGGTRPSGQGAVIQVNTTSRLLRLILGEATFGCYPVAVGKPSTPTPTGRFRILEKVRNPGGPLGTRWMAFTIHRHGIHGTNRPESIGHAVSGGCIRMFNRDVEEVYDRVRIGTPVLISR